MKRISLLTLIVLLNSSQFSIAQNRPPVQQQSATFEVPKYVSQTFQEIQSRVSYRDPESDAILSVRSREDADQTLERLVFAIDELANHAEALITVGRDTMGGPLIYEQYRLRLDDAMRQELKRQLQYREVQIQSKEEAHRVATMGQTEIEHLPASERQAILKNRADSIKSNTNGKLHYGMTFEEVKKVYGDSSQIRKDSKFRVHYIRFKEDHLLCEFVFEGKNLINVFPPRQYGGPTIRKSP